MVINFLPHSLTLLEVIATDEQIKHMIILNKITDYFGDYVNVAKYASKY